MNPIWILFAVAALQAPTAGAPDAERLFSGGQTWEEFLGAVSAQRELWLRIAASAVAPDDLVDRAKTASKGLRLVAVAEDWCPDSVYTLPYVASLARSAGISLRIVDRTAGEPLM